uniref:Uncharacterized protein n=1 Tax=viral metagenome TaxID=1070528 RepID=A0A6C0EKP2_9ZZZZ
MTSDKIWIASFDPGRDNFAFCVEEFDRKELLGVKNIPTAQRYNADGTTTSKMEKILEKVFANGRIVLHKNLDLASNCNRGRTLDPEVFHNMVDALDEYMDYWSKCSAFIIEEQMAFKNKFNKIATKLGQHCYSYFVCKFGRFKEVLTFPAYHKTQVLGAPKVKGKVRWKAMDKPARKKWSVAKAIEILTSRGEMRVLEKLTTARKKDDLADVLTQLQAFKYLVYVDKKLQK